ncbi:LysR family transcriptional regulator [Corynebacterium sp. 13CS0277]|uniref:LysR family transcriptional regulator n=1 Tax=Corynebacterium sp. 13CS0277 TaxID=2071994 RepID=UPI000D042FA9|nr:LysR family transcriptional regulator [Corynebacterium sp. 13CS0277]PRQ12499.1 LysR family transcriptional regulator [Corynebacterium sp. 13CS0277]
MDLQHMRYAIAVAEEHSFTRAAARCFVVQSALSHSIKDLEQELGVKLFARTPRRVELTPAGEAFIAGARASLDAAERARVDAAAAQGLVRGTLTIGVIPTPTAVDIPHLLTRFHAAYPDVQVCLRDGGSEELVAAVKQGVVDVAFVGLAENSPPRGVAARELNREDLALVLPAHHRLAGRQRITLADLSEETFVDFPAGSAGRAQTDHAFHAAGLHRTVAFEATTTDLFLGLIRHGLAIGFLSEKVVPHGTQLILQSVINGPRRVEYLAWNDFNPTPACTALLTVADTH